MIAKKKPYFGVSNFQHEWTKDYNWNKRVNNCKCCKIHKILSGFSIRQFAEWDANQMHPSSNTKRNESARIRRVDKYERI